MTLSIVAAGLMNNPLGRQHKAAGAVGNERVFACFGATWFKAP